MDPTACRQLPATSVPQFPLLQLSRDVTTASSPQGREGPRAPEILHTPGSAGPQNTGNAGHAPGPAPKPAPGSAPGSAPGCTPGQTPGRTARPAPGTALGPALLRAPGHALGRTPSPAQPSGCTQLRALRPTAQQGPPAARLRPNKLICRATAVLKGRAVGAGPTRRRADGQKGWRGRSCAGAPLTHPTRRDGPGGGAGLCTSVALSVPTQLQSRDGTGEVASAGDGVTLWDLPTVPHPHCHALGPPGSVGPPLCWGTDGDEHWAERAVLLNY